jgi:hypothetical protein
MSTMPRDSILKQLDRLEELRDPNSPAAKQRLFHRYVARGDAELRPMSRSQIDHKPVTVKVRDVSRGGIGFLAEQPLPENSTWELVMLENSYATASQPIVIRHCQPVADQLYLVGGQFIAATALMISLGIAPSRLRDDESRGASSDIDSFLPPSEVA